MNAVGLAPHKAVFVAIVRFVGDEFDILGGFLGFLDLRVSITIMWVVSFSCTGLPMPPTA